MDKRMLDDITTFIFMKDSLENADIIFVPGGSYAELGETAAALYHAGYASKIMVTGKYSVKVGCFMGPKSGAERYGSAFETESDFLEAVLLKNGVPKSAILKESASENTYENATFARKIVETQELCITKAIVCCKAFHARRAYMYFQLAFPDVSFVIHPFDYVEEGAVISANTWHLSSMGIKRVMGELWRCGQQFETEFEDRRQQHGF